MERLKVVDIGREKLLDSLLGHVLVSGTAIKKGSVGEIIKNGADHLGEYDIQFIVNGVELPIKKVFDAIEKQDEARITERATEILDNYFDGVYDVVNDTIEDIRDILLSQIGSFLTEKARKGSEDVIDVILEEEV